MLINAKANHEDQILLCKKFKISKEYLNQISSFFQIIASNYAFFNELKPDFECSRALNLTDWRPYDCFNRKTGDVVFNFLKEYSASGYNFRCGFKYFPDNKLVI